MRRHPIRLEEVADIRNLTWAFWRAARGRRHQPDVRGFEQELDTELGTLSAQIYSGSLQVGETRRFLIHDPKRRTIHAPVFRERVLHHALIRWVQPALEPCLFEDVYACRVGKGSHRAAKRAHAHLKRYPWLVKADIKGFFDSVDHDVLLDQLRGRIKGTGVLALCSKIVRAYERSLNRGLPIGALTSQHFANFYLAPLDRYLYETVKVRALIRYMDDIFWWCDTRLECRKSLSMVRQFLSHTLGLEIKSSVQIRPSRTGVGICGFQVRDGRMHLGKRRRQRFMRARKCAEEDYEEGIVDDLGLQRKGTAALAITAHADAVAWRNEQLRRVPPPDA